MKMFCPY